MNEKEKKEFYVATCKCCLLAQVMKDCPGCQFNIGLAEQVKPEYSILLPLSIPSTVFAMADQR